jgi:DNA-binding transcriptional LysR family regulator
MRHDHAIRTKRIEAFRAVMECGSVTAAAGELFVTQPAVTKLLAQLERDIGFALFVRSKGRLTPTPEAKIFYQHVRQTFDALDDLASIARDIKNLNRGSLVVAGLTLLSTAWLPQQCAAFLENREQVNLVLHTHSSARIQDWVISGQADVGVGMIADDARVSSELLAELEAVCILPRTHPLTAKKTITTEDFNGQSFIMTGGVDGTRKKIEGLFKAMDVKVNTRFETILASSTCSFVAAGAGVSLVNGFSAAEFAHLQYEIRAFRPKLCFQIHLLTPRTRPLSHLGQQFVEHLRCRAARDLASRPAS